MLFLGAMDASAALSRIALRGKERRPLEDRFFVRVPWLARRFNQWLSPRTLRVAGPHFWSYAVAECDAETSDVATTPGDEVSRELLTMVAALFGEVEDEAAFFRRMIDERRLVVRLRVRRLYGVLLAKPPGS
jgi:hypothetical protein